MGETFHHFAASYPTVEAVILEALQNAFDPDVLARNVHVSVNEKSRNVTITDDGNGISQELFVDRLGTVCTRQRKGAGATGRFGIGLMASLGKCKLFRFVSCPSPHVDRYNEWTFDSAAILAAEKMPPVDQRLRPDLRFGAPIRWRSMIQLEGVSTDVSVSHVDMEGLVRKILVNHRQKMLSLGARVSIRIVRASGKIEERPDVQASRFRGDPLGEFLTSGDLVGQVSFSLFRSPETVGKDQGPGLLVGIIGDDFRLPFDALAKDIKKLGVNPQAIEALKSGVFEGEMLFQNLRLLASRRGFEKTDVLNDVAVAISRWFKRVGAEAYEQIQAERQKTKNVDRGLVSMAVIERLLQEFPEFEGAIHRFVDVGSVGKGHARVPRTRVVGSVRATSVDGHRRGRGDGEPGSSRDRSGKPKELKGHTPLTVAGPHEPERTLVRGNSLGLCIAYALLEGDDLFEFDKERGVLTFNVQHPVWASAEDNGGDKAIYALQEFCMLNLLTMLSQPEQEHDVVVRFTMKTVPLVLRWLLKGKDLRK